MHFPLHMLANCKLLCSLHAFFIFVLIELNVGVCNNTSEVAAGLLRDLIATAICFGNSKWMAQACVANELYQAQFLWQTYNAKPAQQLTIMSLVYLFMLEWC